MDAMKNSSDALGREVEIKLDLGSLENYRKLLRAYDAFDAGELQCNGFFDSPEKTLWHAGWALRVRAEPTAGLVTIKSRIARSVRPATIREELEARISKETALEVLGGRKEILELNVKPLWFITARFGDLKLGKTLQFDNWRQKKTAMLGSRRSTIEIDRTEFPDGSVDFELEVELGDPGETAVVEKALRRLLRDLEIPFRVQTASKLERALQRTDLVDLDGGLVDDNNGDDRALH